MRTPPAQGPAARVVSVGQLPVDENEVISVDLHRLGGPTGEAGVAAPAWVGGVPPAVVEGDAVPLLAGAVGLDPTPDSGLVAVQRVHLHPGGVLGPMERVVPVTQADDRAPVRVAVLVRPEVGARVERHVAGRVRGPRDRRPRRGLLLSGPQLCGDAQPQRRGGDGDGDGDGGPTPHP